MPRSLTAFTVATSTLIQEAPPVLFGNFLPVAVRESAPDVTGSVYDVDGVRLWLTEESLEGTSSIRLPDVSDAVAVGGGVNGEHDPRVFRNGALHPLSAGRCRFTWREAATYGRVVRDSSTSTVGH